MKKSLVLISILLIIAACTKEPQPVPPTPEPPAPEPISQEDSLLRKKIAQMLVIGFQGTEITTNSHIYRDITQYGLGSVILYEYTGRNIASKQQLARLCADLQKAAGGDLLISIDQEGGKVNRLKSKYGFPEFPDADYLGKNIDDTTAYWAAQTADNLASLGINLNFAPCADVNVNPKSPAIGALARSFSDNPQIVAQKASIWVAEHSKRKVLSCLKHFPGHGSASSDTHLGSADISESWQEYELFPYQYLIQKEQLDLVMIGHVYHANMDKDYPASLSSKVINGLLRDSLKYNGAVITDDLGMGALASLYPYDKILELSINAGVDLLCLSNSTSPYNQDIVPETIDLIFRKVKEGKIDRRRILAAAERVAALKKKVAQ